MSPHPLDAAAARARHLVVDGQVGLANRDLLAARRSGQRQEVDERLKAEAARAARRVLPICGALLAVQGVVALVQAQSVGPALWVWAAGTVAIVPLLFMRPPALMTGRWLPTLATLAAVGLVLPAWWVDPARLPLVLAWAALSGCCGAVVLAMRSDMAVPFAAIPAVLGLAALGYGGWVWVGFGVLGSSAAATCMIICRRVWRRQTRRVIEQADLLRRFERERDQARRTDSEKSRFLAIASHDLRQPVHALGLFAATLQRRLQHSPDEALARNLMRAVDGLERSFNAMLDISKLDAGALSTRVETFALRDMFRRLHMQYGGRAEFAGLGLRFSPGGKSVTSDPQLLERIIGNLVQNAIKYTSRGGIVVVARSTERSVNIEVWDTGCGIAPEELPRIFNEFYQVGHGERDRSHGLGMGLAIVKRLAGLLGHRLEVASTLGRGTMFRIGVPIGGLPGIQEDLGPADTQPMTIEIPQMVLVVDDEEPIREGLRVLLQEWGYQVITAANAAQAELAASALEGHVDLVLSDLHLGDGPDGVEVVAAVRRLCGRDVPAILVTGETAPEQIQPLAAGEDPLLFKPVQPRRLYDALRATLG